MITSAQACDALSIDRSTLSRWVAAGRITPIFKHPGVRGAFLFAPGEVERVRKELISQIAERSERLTGSAADPAP
jgi:predicted site-specific integrase-resolvase